jgi:sec-independent protein translocase protein TatB
MLDFDVGKMVVFGIVALAVIPPKDLPRVMRYVGQFVGKMRRMAAEFQGQFMEAMREADLESVKKEFESMEKAAKVDSSFDPVMAMRSEMTRAVEPGQPAQTVEIGPPQQEPIPSGIVATPLPEPATVKPTEPAMVERTAEAPAANEAASPVP